MRQGDERKKEGHLLRVRKVEKECAIPDARVGIASGRGSRMCKGSEEGKSLVHSRSYKETRCGLIIWRKGEVIGKVFGGVNRRWIRQSLEGCANRGELSV